MYKLLLKSILTALFFCAMSNYGTAQFSGGGNGTSTLPYLIKTAADLDQVRNYMGSGIYFRLVNDIDLFDYLDTGVGFTQWGLAGWKPIGSGTALANRFQGNFDGNGKKIIGLWISRSGTGGEDYVGLFGSISGTIYNLGVEIHANGIRGLNKVGGLVGGAYYGATITKVYTTGTGEVRGTDGVGGLVGEAIGSSAANVFINSAYSTCNIQAASGFYKGGLIGYANHSIISNVYATGNVNGNQKIGGLAGVIVENSSISYAYATGIVSGREFVGGLVGEIQDDSSVKNCVVANGSITASTSGGLINRIVSNELIRGTFTSITGNILRNNYNVNSGMTVTLFGSNITGTIIDNLNYLPGASRPLADLKSFNFYNTTSNWDGGSWDIALDNSKTWNIKNGASFPFLSWQYAFSASALMSFGLVYEDYVQPAAQTVTITSEGLNSVTLIQPVSTYYEIGILSPTTLNAMGQTATFTVRPKAGLDIGTYNETIIIYSNEGASATVDVSFKVLKTPIPPFITGDSYMTLTEGYSATSTNTYSIFGTTPVTVIKLSGDDRITWNNSTQKLDIAAGLPVGVYEVKLRAENSTTKFYTYIFTLTVKKKVYYIDIPQTIVGGSLTVKTEEPYLAYEGETVTLIVTPDKGYELESINVYMSDASGNVIRSVVIPLKGSGNTYTFSMPAHHIAIEISFYNTVGIEDIRANILKAFAQNGMLYVSGLTTGEMLSIYNITGTLIYQGVANSNEMEIHLSGRGVYLIRSNKNTVKVIN